MKAIDRINAKVIKREDGCWIFTGAGKGGTPDDDYGCVRINGRQGKTVYAHKVAFEAVKGRVPAGLVIMHSCNVKRCVNPQHLFAGSLQQNAKDAYKDGLVKLPTQVPGSSGLLGVHKSVVKGYEYWVATCCVEGKRTVLYHGKDFFEACCARKSWEVRQ